MTWLVAPWSPSALEEGDSTSPSIERLATTRLARCCTWRGRLSLRRTWRVRWRRGGWIQLLSGLTSRASREKSSRQFEEWLNPQPARSSPPASRASRGARQELVAAPVTPGGCGPRSAVPFAIFDPASSVWRTSQVSLLEDSDMSSARWPLAGMTRLGRAFEHRTLEHLIDGAGSSSPLCGATWDRGEYPTPTAASYGTSQNEGEVPHDRPSRGTPSLETWARAWSTPTWGTPCARDGKGPSNYDKCLARQVSTLQAGTTWRTPMVADATASSRPDRRDSPFLVSLASQVSTLQVPTTQRGTTSQQTIQDGSRQSTRATGPPLNPLFVMWLMGWCRPAAETSCASPATASCPTRPRQHSATFSHSSALSDLEAP